MEDEEEELIPYFPQREMLLPEGRVALTQHAVEQAMSRFNCRSVEAAEEFLLDHLQHATRSRRRPSGALRWTDGTIQLVTVQDGSTVVVLTCYPMPLGRLLHAFRKRRWGKNKAQLKAAIGDEG